METVEPLDSPAHIVGMTQLSGTISEVTEAKTHLFSETIRQLGSHVSDIQQQKLLELLIDFADIFAATPDDLGRTGKLPHHIDTGNAHPIRQPPRRIPPLQRKQAQEILQKMLEKDIVQPSTSPWASPIVLVRKKDGSQRFCVDYRKLNGITKKDAYPIPRIDDTLDTLAGSCWFSTLDLVSGYWQVEMSPTDREKTAFCVPDGLFEFKVMPFGLSNAPATFQRLMDLLLAGLKWNTCLVYLDDVIVVGSTFEEHLFRLREVFQRFRDAGLKLNPNKCSFCQTEVHFLGHIISARGIRTDPTKTNLVASWPVPTSTKEVQKFLGLANYYRRFVPNFAAKAKPLHKLTEKTAKFKWSVQCQEAFSELKKCLISAPVLSLPDFTRQFILDTDACDSGIGAVLSQKQSDGSELVIAYSSRVLSKPERHYCVTRKELLAAVSFIKHFRPYLLGRPFILRTDHGSLTWLYKFRNPEGQLARWLETLQEYDFQIVHRQGRLHGNADAMSRRPCNQCGRDCQTTNEEMVTVSLVQRKPTLPERSDLDLREFQLNDPCIAFVLRAKETDQCPSSEVTKGQSLTTRRLVQLWQRLQLHNGILYRQYEDVQTKQQWTQFIVPQPLRDEVLEEIHAGIMAGHLGEEKTLQQLKKRFYWPGHSRDMKIWCQRCATCASRKSPAPKNCAPLHTVSAGSPMQIIAVDIMGPLPESWRKNSYVLVMADYFTKWIEVFAICDQEAGTVAQKLVDEVFCRFGIPEQLHSDKGKQFEGNVIKEICKILNISKSRTTSYHPQGDGLVERCNRTLQDMIATTISEHPFDWEEALPKVQMAYNLSVHSTTGYSPFFLTYGREARLPVDIVYGTQSLASSTVDTYAQKSCKLLEESFNRVREHLLAGHQKQKHIYDKRIHGDPYKVGDTVWLLDTVVDKDKSRKFHHPWKGPYQIVKKISDCDYHIKSVTNQGEQIVHFNRLKPCKPGTRFHQSISAEEDNQSLSIEC